MLCALPRAAVAGATPPSPQAARRCFSEHGVEVDTKHFAIPPLVPRSGASYVVMPRRIEDPNVQAWTDWTASLPRVPGLGATPNEIRASFERHGTALIQWLRRPAGDPRDARTVTTCPGPVTH
jgi:hypothetical protein